MRAVAPYLPVYEIEKIFNFFDQDHDNLISFHEFQQKLAKPKTISCDKQKAKRVFYQLRYIIKKNRINLGELFVNVNKAGNQQISLNEFCVMPSD